MQQLTFNESKNQMSLLEVPTPTIADVELLVRTRASLISAGTEPLDVDLGLDDTSFQNNMSFFANSQNIAKATARQLSSMFSNLEEPMPIGFSAAGEVVKSGAKTQIPVGTRVALYGSAQANHADFNATHHKNACIIPENVPYKHAAFAAIGTIALEGFQLSKASVGQNVMVIGLGLIGQMTVQIAKAAGCRVLAADFDDMRISLAGDCGADCVHLLSAGNTEGLVAEFTEEHGFDAIIICTTTDSNTPLEGAANWAKNKATVVMSGKSGTQIPYTAFMKKQLSFIATKTLNAGSNTAVYRLKEVLNLMRDGQLNIEPLISHSYPFAEAESAYALTKNTNDIATMGIVLEMDGPAEDRRKNRINLRPTEIVTGKVGIGFIGNPRVIESDVLPFVSHHRKEIDLCGIQTPDGLSARTIAEKYKFSFAAGLDDEIFSDVNTHAVILAHPSPVEQNNLIRKALENGKHVLSITPAGMCEDDYLKLQASQEDSNGKVLVLNTPLRYAPLSQAVKEKANTSAEAPCALSIHATYDIHAHGGAIGQLAILSDLAMYLTGSRIQKISTTQSHAKTLQLTSVLQHANSSITTLTLVHCEKKENSEVDISLSHAHTTATIKDFKTAQLKSGGKTFVFKAGQGLLFSPKQDFGVYNQIANFVNIVKGDATQTDLSAAHMLQAYQVAHTILSATTLAFKPDDENSLPEVTDNCYEIVSNSGMGVTQESDDIYSNFKSSSELSESTLLK
jgi:threonine dehydrogenase-like Zn-dependent dehydrogenase/predicted dehydrogenase